MDWNRFSSVVAMRETGAVNEAMVELEKLLNCASDAEEKSAVLLEQGRCLLDRNLLDDADITVQEALNILPEHSASLPFAKFSLACIAMHKEDWDRATGLLQSTLRDYSESLSGEEHKPFRSMVRLKLLLLQVALGRTQDAIAEMQNLEQNELSSEQQAALLYIKARIAQLCDLPPRAEGLFRAALESYLLSADLKFRASYYLAECLYARGSYSESLEMFLAVDKLANENRFAKGDLADRIAAISKAINKGNS